MCLVFSLKVRTLTLKKRRLMPLAALCYPLDSLAVTMRRRFEPGDNYFTALSKEWNAGIRDVFSRLADLEW
jgi:putative proteasome-type protease